jgi:hypothetical protein
MLNQKQVAHQSYRQNELFSAPEPEQPPVSVKKNEPENDDVDDAFLRNHYRVKTETGYRYYRLPYVDN